LKKLAESLEKKRKAKRERRQKKLNFFLCSSLKDFHLKLDFYYSV